MQFLLVLLLLYDPAAADDSGLLPYTVENAAAIASPLTEAEAGPEGGSILFDSAGCAFCHEEGTAPRLDDAGARLTEAEMRMMIVDPRIVYPETAMPAYYTPGRFGEAPEPLIGRTLLSATEIERLVEWLATRRGD